MEMFYELRFYWDDQEEAAYRGTEKHRQDGMLKVKRLDNETENQFNTRAKFYHDKTIRNLFSNLARRGRGCGVVSSTFPK